jgi:hypothetical protein
MKTFDLLPLQEYMVQHGACKHSQWQGYLTVLVVNHEIIKSITVLTAAIRPMIQFDVYTPWDYFRQEVNCTLAIH